MFFKPFLCVFILLFLGQEFFGQSTSIGQAWSKNTVNTVVFRKNSVVSFKENQYVSFYDPEGYLTLAKRRSGTENWEVKRTQYKVDVTDAHRSISIMVDGDGFLHVSWGHHADQLNYCKSEAPEVLVLSNKIEMIGNAETDVTYPEFHKLPDGDLIFLYRDGGSGNGNLVMNKYETSTKKWKRVRDNLIDGEGKRNAYWQAYVDAMGTIHVSWVWRESAQIETNHDMCYARSTDFGVNWQKTTGEYYELPINQARSEYAVKIPQNSGLINTTAMYADERGKPYIATYFRPNGSSIPQYHLIYNNNGQWKTTQISNRITSFSLSGAGTKKIPISRPQIIVKKGDEQSTIYVMYRDIENGNKVSIIKSTNSKFTKWKSENITDFSVSDWEPSYDTELWKEQGKLHLYVQKTGQGDGEGLEAIPPQPVYIYAVDTNNFRLK